MSSYRLFSKKHQLYTNSPNWPSNQRTWSEWALSSNGEVLEMVSDDGGGDFCFVEKHDKRNFSIEPWTGLFDINGKKIYRGDVLGAKKGAYNNEIDPIYSAEVVWSDAGFCANDGSGFYSWLNDDVSIWKTIFVKGNIHNVEYCD